MVLMASLARNTYYNLTAFGLNTVISLATVPLLVGTFGLGGYGILILARLLLPTGILGLLEAGMPEVTARTVAAAKAVDDLPAARRTVTAAAVTAVGVGLVAGLILAGFSEPLAQLLFHSNPALHDALQLVVLISAASLPLQLFGSIARGAFEGAEHFRLVRGLEVASNAAFFMIALFLAYQPDANLAMAAIAYVMVWNARAVLYLAVVVSGRIASVRFTSSDIWSDYRTFLSHAMRLFLQKFLSILMSFGPSVVIGLLSSAAMVGSYDIVMRIPKVMKTAAGMFNGALLPFAARSDALGDSDSTRRVVEDGTMFLASFIIAGSATVMVLSGEILKHWLGLTGDELPAWLSIAMLWPISICSFGIGSTMLMSRIAASGQLSRLALISTATYYALVIVLFLFIGWPGFVISLVLSQLIVVPSYWKLQKAQFGVDLALWRRYALWTTVIVVAAYLLLRLLFSWLEIGNLAILAVSGALVFFVLLGLIGWLAIARSVWNRWLPRLRAVRFS